MRNDVHICLPECFNGSVLIRGIIILLLTFLGKRGWLYFVITGGEVIGMVGWDFTDGAEVEWEIKNRGYGRVDAMSCFASEGIGSQTKIIIPQNM